MGKEITRTVIGERGQEETRELNPSITHIVVAKTLKREVRRVYEG